jgi:hypothetical protein
MHDIQVPWQVDNDAIDINVSKGSKGKQYVEQGCQGHSEGLQ